MPAIDTVVIGAGHAGLAVSRCLTEDGRDHVVLDRGQVGERWRSERWDSLHLLTPNWMSRLPGWAYPGEDQDGYMSTTELVHHLEAYARSFAAPVESGTTVLDVSATAGGYTVATDRGTWTARNVVVATGPWGRPAVPDAVQGLHPDVHLETSSGYRNPDVLPAGGVLVVGASSSGVQIADELARSGRTVLLSVGRHTRMPRSYRGMDIFWWLQATGRLSRTIDEVPDPARARREPSLQLVGRPGGESGRTDIDLGTLRDIGVELLGRLVSTRGTKAHFAGDLPSTTGSAEAQLRKLLSAVDAHVDAHGLASEVLPPDPPARLRLRPGSGSVNLRRAGVRTVLLATGHLPHHPWLRVPVLGPDGVIRQHRGVTPAPGMYVVGQRFQHRRDSSFIDGARHDAHAVVAHIRSTDHSRIHAPVSSEVAS